MANQLRIGLVFTYSLSYCREILRGVKDFARTKQHWIFTPVAPEDDGLRVLKALKPQGIIAHIYSRELARSLVAMRKPLVNVSGVMPKLSVPRVGLDDVGIGRLAARHLLDRGLRNFAFVGHSDQPYSQRREHGFRDELRSVGGEVACYHETQTRFDPRGRLWALDPGLLRWVASLPKPVGAFACNDIWGFQISEACRQVLRRIPEDLALLGVDDDDLLCDLARPSLSSVSVPAREVGRKAAALLEHLLDGGRPPAEDLELPPTGVVTRQSSNLLAIHDAEVSAAIRFIRENAHRPLAIDDVLESVAVCRRTLERRFRDALNRGIWDEIRRVHMERAKNLLTSTDWPMSIVATAAGFSDGKHLSIVFRRETGLTPTAYRRQLNAHPRHGSQLAIAKT